MATKLYSERFLQGRQSGTNTYVVPFGYRAVVRNVVLVNARNDVLGYLVLSVAGVRVIQAYPAVNETRVYDLRQVVYGGEAVIGTVNLDNVFYAVSGYLFRDDPAAAVRPAGEGSGESDEVTVQPELVGS